ncbi:MAG: hypothetical protein M1546_23920 [Chloroflexi bacterium]|nr:hypothetical protein [Chloroflexota bacterium]
MSLLEDLEKRIKGCARRSRLNYFMAYTLLVIGVLGSISATILVALGIGAKEIVAVLAALPTISVLVMNTFRFEARADWWEQKRAGMDALWRSLQYEKKPEDEVSKALTAFLDRHEKAWPTFRKLETGSGLKE